LSSRHLLQKYSANPARKIYESGTIFRHLFCAHKEFFPRMGTALSGKNYFFVKKVGFFDKIRYDK